MRGPEGNEKAQHEWVTNELVEDWYLHTHMRVLDTTPVQIDLPQSKQVKVIDQKGGEQNERPADQVETLQENATCCMLNIPDGSRMGSHCQ